MAVPLKLTCQSSTEVVYSFWPIGAVSVVQFFTVIVPVAETDLQSPLPAPCAVMAVVTDPEADGFS